MLKQILTIAALLLTTQLVQAEDATFKGESEASAIIVSGNTNTETIGAKTKNTWAVTDLDLATAFGTYLNTKSAGTVSGKSWIAGLRYERVITKDVFSGYVQQMAEHDPYNGVFTQRDSTDIGAKYFFTKFDDLTWFGEFGYRYSSIYDGVVTSDKSSANYLRAYTEVASKFNVSTSGKLWLEYLADLKNSDKSLWNAEASLTAIMTSMFSFKTSFLVKHNEGAAVGSKKDTTTWTTALVANY
jgi:putative salt-induced outer membrane protein